MCKRRTLSFLLILLCILAACAPAAPQIIIMPTLAVLPSVTPLPTDTSSPTVLPSATSTPQPTATLTPNLVETRIAQLDATNVSSQLTMALLLTKSAPTNTLDVTLRPSETITNTLPPSLTVTVTLMPPAVVAMQAQLIYARSTANLRTCAAQSCEKIAQLQAGESVTANGSIEGEAIDAGHSTWYRVDYRERALYVYGQLISFDAPTMVPIFVPPTAAPISLPPVSVPQSSGNSGGGSCPDIKASCSALTCDQAYACLAAGHRGLDNDHDGIPCESVCGG
jgi:hypothetical protein